MTTIDTMNPELDVRRCSNCRFFEEMEYTEEYGNIGACKKNAPAPYVAGMILKESLFAAKFSTSASWPVVRETDWCGEHVANVMELQEDQDAGI